MQAKKQRILQAEAEFSSGLLSAESLSDLKLQYAESKPFHHGVINPLINNELLERVRIELENLQFTEKETDIYKVNQTGDLANLDKLNDKELEKLSAVMTLKNAIYSKAFRDFIGEIVGIRGISGKNIDLSVNRYTKGCHLLNHDDVIGDRCVSFILYLPDPSEEWKSEYGGKLELYPVKVKGTPQNKPSISIVPTSNSFAFFAVQPGLSFHSVEEVVSDKVRISIQGWYHFAKPDEPEYMEQKIEDGLAQSTLQQLLECEFDRFEDYSIDDSDLTETDIEYLAEFINPAYLVPNTIEQVNVSFCNESQIQLIRFLKKELAEKLKPLITEIDSVQLTDGMTPHGTGEGNGWVCNGPPHLQRYLSAVGDDLDEAATELRKVQCCFESVSFKKWLSMVCSLAITARKSKIRRFRPGLDYTLALSNRKQVIHGNLCLTIDNNRWETGEVGGYSCYMMPHESQDAAVYSQTDDDSILSSTGAAWNNFMIVLRDEDILHFVKYISANAPSSRWDIDCEFLVNTV